QAERRRGQCAGEDDRTRTSHRAIIGMVCAAPLEQTYDLKKKGRPAFNAGRPNRCTGGNFLEPSRQATGDLPRRFVFLSRGVTSFPEAGPKRTCCRPKNRSSGTSARTYQR